MDRERKLLPRLGTRKIYSLIKEELQQKQLSCGRDKLFALMRHYDLQIKPRRRYTQTTMSKHWLRKWPNIIKDQQATVPDQIWVSDITYLKTQQGNCYLNMITDAYSRKIVGYAVAENMETESMIGALDMAIIQKRNLQQPTIHHSDRGLQYCSSEYVELLKANNIQISMTGNGDPLENPIAERINGIIKNEYLKHHSITNQPNAIHLLEKIVYKYNQQRPHQSINMLTPELVHQHKLLVNRKWRKQKQLSNIVNP